MKIRVVLYLLSVILLGVLVLVPAQALAHAQGYIPFEIDVNLEEIVARGQAESGDDAQALQDRMLELRQLRPRDLEAEFKDLIPKFLKSLVAQTDVDHKKIVVRDVYVLGVGDGTQPRLSTLQLSVELGMNVQELSLTVPPELGTVPLRIFDKDDELAHEFQLKDGIPTAFVPIENLVTIIPFKGKDYGRRLHVIQQFVVVGFEHIVPKGLDHILFVVGLFLLSTRIRPLLIQITSFTAAHTLSLALAILGLVNVVPSIVEPLIALSIVYVCVENIFLSNLSRWRPVLVFLFGLLHGLGFAGVLQDAQLPESHFVVGLVAFNIGVELGQLVVIGVCFLLVGLWFGRRDWYRNVITIPASAIIGLIGAIWFFERVFLA